MPDDIYLLLEPNWKRFCFFAGDQLLRLILFTILKQQMVWSRCRDNFTLYFSPISSHSFKSESRRRFFKVTLLPRLSTSTTAFFQERSLNSARSMVVIKLHTSMGSCPTHNPWRGLFENYGISCAKGFLGHDPNGDSE